MNLPKLLLFPFSYNEHIWQVSYNRLLWKFPFCFMMCLKWKRWRLQCTACHISLGALLLLNHLVYHINITLGMQDYIILGVSGNVSWLFGDTRNMLTIKMVRIDLDTKICYPLIYYTSDFTWNVTNSLILNGTSYIH